MSFDQEYTNLFPSGMLNSLFPSGFCPSGNKLFKIPSGNKFVDIPSQNSRYYLFNKRVHIKIPQF